MSDETLMCWVKLGSRHQPTGRTHHYYGTLGPNGDISDLGDVPVPTELHIVFADESYYLLYLDAEGHQLTDTWHQTLDDALHQAEFEFGVQHDEWNEPA